MRNRFKEARTEYNRHGPQTTREVADAAGITKSLIEDIESTAGTPRNVGYLTVKKLAQYYGVSSDFLLGLSETPSVDKDMQIACKTTGLSQKAVETLIPHAQDWQTWTISRLIEEYPYFLPVLSDINNLIIVHGESEAMKTAYANQSKEIAKMQADVAWKTPRKPTADEVKGKELQEKAFRFSIYESLMRTVDKLVEKTYSKEGGNNGKRKQG